MRRTLHPDTCHICIYYGCTHWVTVSGFKHHVLTAQMSNVWHSAANYTREGR